MRKILLLIMGVGPGLWAGAALALPPGHRALEAFPRVAQAEAPLPVPAAPDAGGENSEETPADRTPGADEGGGADDGSAMPEDFSIGEIPVIETIELTPEMARRALDAYILVKEKYKDSDLEQYENLQDFVDLSSDGRSFEADIKAAGFADVNAWNLAITTLTFAYSNAIDDQSADILQQIAEIEQDSELAQDMKDRMIASLKAMIPSENNAKVVSEMLADPVYASRLKQLELEEE